MLFNLILTILCGVAFNMLLDKWQVDNYMNTHPVWHKYWPANPCALCRGFWAGCIVFWLLSLFPVALYLFVPLAAIPVQVWLYSFYVKSDQNRTSL